MHRYATPAERLALGEQTAKTPTSTYASVTQRFRPQGSSGPAVGSYEPHRMEKAVSGAVKLQKMIRRRQSRGIFASQIAHAQQMPSPTKYQPASSLTDKRADSAFKSAQVAVTSSPSLPFQERPGQSVSQLPNSWQGA